MSYKVLARKWRPQHFRDMLGQEPVLRALINALDSDRLHHAYLFTGMRGVGKTTIARIFAKCLNCETYGVTSDPCGTCSACVDIDAGRFFDLIEVDAASRTKVEGTRELLENVPYAPASGRYKVYLIDEVHMFSTHSFNALLKTLEEPPEHVKFLLATTDPQKVPATVLSRCLQFNLKRMSPGILTDYLTKILTEESIEYERPALDLIARASEGSVRDSLSLVEQAAASGGGAVLAETVESMLGRASVERLLQLIETLDSNDLPALFQQVDELAEYAPEFSELMGELLSLLHRIAMLQSVPGSVADTTPGYERLSALADSLDADAVQLFYQIGLHARRDMPFAPDTREAFDMALLRMHTFRPATPAAADLQPAGDGVLNEPSLQNKHAQQTHTQDGSGHLPSATHSGAATATGPESASTAKPPPAGLKVRGSVSAGGSLREAALAAARGEVPPPMVQHQPIMQPEQPGGQPSHQTARTPVEIEAVADADTGPLTENDRQVTDDTPVQISSVENCSVDTDPAAASASGLDKTRICAADWPQLVGELDIAGMPLQLASHCIWVTLDAQTVHLQIEQSSEHLLTKRFVQRLENSLSTWFGTTLKVTIEQVDAELETPARLAERQAAADLAAAHDSINLDPIVRQLIDQVDGAVDESSIRPVSGPADSA